MAPPLPASPAQLTALPTLAHSALLHALLLHPFEGDANTCTDGTRPNTRTESNLRGGGRTGTSTGLRAAVLVALPAGVHRPRPQRLAAAGGPGGGAAVGRGGAGRLLGQGLLQTGGADGNSSGGEGDEPPASCASTELRVMGTEWTRGGSSEEWCCLVPHSTVVRVCCSLPARRLPTLVPTTSAEPPPTTTPFPTARMKFSLVSALVAGASLVSAKIVGSHDGMDLVRRENHNQIEKRSMSWG